MTRTPIIIALSHEPRLPTTYSDNTLSDMPVHCNHIHLTCDLPKVRPESVKSCRCNNILGHDETKL